MDINIILLVTVIVLLFVNLRKVFKIAYYEAKLKNRNINIERVEKMPFYKLWINYEC